MGRWGSAAGQARFGGWGSRGTWVLPEWIERKKEGEKSESHPWSLFGTCPPATVRPIHPRQQNTRSIVDICTAREGTLQGYLYLDGCLPQTISVVKFSSGPFWTQPVLEAHNASCLASLSKASRPSTIRPRELLLRSERIHARKYHVPLLVHPVLVPFHSHSIPSPNPPPSRALARQLQSLVATGTLRVPRGIKPLERPRHPTPSLSLQNISPVQAGVSGDRIALRQHAMASRVFTPITSTLIRLAWCAALAFCDRSRRHLHKLGIRLRHRHSTMVLLYTNR